MTDKIERLLDDLSPEEQGALIDELHRIAKRYMFKEGCNHTLQATALVNEAYLNLSGKTLMLTNQRHFIAIAARQMRRILVDHARQKLSQKRQKEISHLTLAAIPSEEASPLELIYIDRLLTEFSQFDERAAKVYELRLFSGLQNMEIAELLELSIATVERDAKLAKAWLQAELNKL